jgi:short-subunit dehydrogenase
MIDVNVRALVALTRAFLPGMVERRSGAVVNVASNAAFQPVPYMSVYAASKAFVLSFTEALANELRGTGVKVQALCPGITATEFLEVAGTHSGLLVTRMPMLTSEEVVEASLRGREPGAGRPRALHPRRARARGGGAALPAQALAGLDFLHTRATAATGRLLECRVILAVS